MLQRAERLNAVYSEAHVREGADTNPFGIHYLKFLFSVLIIATHALAFVGIFSGYKFETNDTWLMRALALLPSAVGVPVAAGALQAILFSRLIVENRLSEIRLKPIAGAMALLAFIESLKASFILPSLFFGWNVIHMTAVALLTVLALAKRSLHFVWISALIVFAVTPALRDALAPFQVATYEDVVSIHTMGISDVLLHVIGLGCFLAFVVWALRTRLLESKYRPRVMLVGSVVYGAFLLISSSIGTETFFAARLLNLPIGALVGDKLGLHYWPLFPWYTVVAAGFLLYVVWLKASRPQIAKMATLFFSASVMVYYLKFHFVEIVAELDPTYIWTFKLFNGSMWLIIYSICSFALTAVACDALAESRFFQSLTAKWPLLFRVPYVYSRTIFWSYVAVNTVAIPLAWLFAKVLPKNVSIFVFPCFFIVSWYWVGGWILKWFTQTRFKVRFSGPAGNARVR